MNVYKQRATCKISPAIRYLALFKMFQWVEIWINVILTTSCFRISISSTLQWAASSSVDSPCVWNWFFLLPEVQLQRLSSCLRVGGDVWTRSAPLTTVPRQLRACCCCWSYFWKVGGRLWSHLCTGCRWGAIWIGDALVAPLQFGLLEKKQRFHKNARVCSSFIRCARSRADAERKEQCGSYGVVTMVPSLWQQTFGKASDLIGISEVLWSCDPE